MKVSGALYPRPHLRCGAGYPKGQPSFRRWCGFELGATNHHAADIPAGVAHGFLTLEDESDVLYQIDRIYRSGFDAGVRWDDPAFAIAWPERPALIHPRDAAFADFAV